VLLTSIVLIINKAQEYRDSVIGIRRFNNTIVVETSASRVSEPGGARGAMAPTLLKTVDFGY